MLKVYKLRRLHIGTIIAESFVNLVLLAASLEDLVGVSHSLQKTLREIDIEFTVHVDADVFELVKPFLVIQTHREWLNGRLPATSESVEVAD